MRVLVLGGSGFVGEEIIHQLQAGSDFEPVVGSRRPKPVNGCETVAVDACQSESLSRVLGQVDAVINCITGSGEIIVESTRQLVDGLTKLDRKLPLVHMSTMSVYGAQEGDLTESAELAQDIGWYGDAKVKAEQLLAQLDASGRACCILRPGCVYGPGSALWTDRIIRLIRQRRLGDLGIAGDGWSNLVHVRDVARAAVLWLQKAQHQGDQSGMSVYNLSAPDSPRWNDYFRDVALAQNVTPLCYLSSRRLKLEGMLLAPPLKVAERIIQRMRWQGFRLPDGMPPSLLRLWSQQIRLNSRAISEELAFPWTPYEEGLRQTMNPGW